MINLKYSQRILVLTRPDFKRKKNCKSKQLGFYPSLTNLRERGYSPTACSSHVYEGRKIPISFPSSLPHGGREIANSSPYSLSATTKQEVGNQQAPVTTPKTTGEIKIRTPEEILACHLQHSHSKHSQTPCQIIIKCSIKGLFTSDPFTKVIIHSFQNTSKHGKRQKLSLKRQNTHQILTQIWQRYWNYQTRNLKQL